jgi:hypothetical protein
MRYVSLLASVFLVMASESSGVSGQTPNTAAQVAVAPFAVEHDSAGVLRAAADSTLERLARTLTEKGVTVLRLKQLSEKGMHAARPARWAVLGKFKREKGTFDAELRLMDVESAEEQVSYFNSDKDALRLASIGEGAGARIAAYVKERK